MYCSLCKQVAKVCQIFSIIMKMNFNQRACHERSKPMMSHRQAASGKKAPWVILARTAIGVKYFKHFSQLEKICLEQLVKWFFKVTATFSSPKAGDFFFFLFFFFSLECLSHRFLL